jgi:hypothetical protein
LPKAGARLEIDGLVVTVRRTSRKRVEEILIELKEELRSGEAESL